MNFGTNNNGSQATCKVSQPYAMLGAGPITASVWKDGEPSSGWRYSFNLFRMSRSSGHVSQRFTPRDIADLMKVGRLLAVTLAEDGCLDSDVRESLMRLAERLDDAFLPGAASSTAFRRDANRVSRLLRSILEYLWDDAEREFTAEPSEGHIYRKLVTLDRWLAGVELPIRDVMQQPDSEQPLGGCPICGQCDGHFRCQIGAWAACHEHQTRWCVDERHCESVTAAREVTWDSIHAYRVVAPLRPATRPSKPDR